MKPAFDCLYSALSFRMVFSMFMKPQFAAFVIVALLTFVDSVSSHEAKIRPVIGEMNGKIQVEYWSDDVLVSRSTKTSPAGVTLKIPGGEWRPVEFRLKTQQNGVIELESEKLGALSLRMRIMQKTPSLVERTLEVTADRTQQFTVAFPFEFACEGELASFVGPENNSVVYETFGGAPEYSNIKGLMFPLGMVKAKSGLFGLIADSPGFWENRCLIEFDPALRRVTMMSGDGRNPTEMRIVNDARDQYVGMIDGWQSLAPGETRRFQTWVFADRGRWL